MQKEGRKSAPFSLTLRLMLAAGGVVLFALVLGGIFLSFLFRDVATRSFDAYLQAGVSTLIQNIRLNEDGTLNVVSGIGDARFMRPRSGWYWQIKSGEGVFLRSISLWDQSLTFHHAAQDVHMQGQRLYQGQRIRFIAEKVFFPERAQGVWVTVTGETSVLEGDFRRFDRTLMIALSVFGVLLVLGIMLQVHFGLYPLRRLRSDLALVRQGKRSTLGRAPFPSEIRPLVEEINSLIRHNAGLVERARRHVGNLAHALRTPLTAMTSALEADGLQSHDNKALAETLRPSLTTMEGHVRYHLARARAGSRASTARTTFLSVVHAIQGVLHKVYPDCRIDVIGDDHGRVFIGDKHDLEEIIGNIMENACKWAQDTVHVTLQIEEDTMTIAIDDNGSGLPANKRKAVFQRGKRLDEMKPGSGLGLSIVRDHLELYGGTITLADSELGGLRALLRLPMVPL
ncbi:MAG: GHKL domain-containing protein [Alphaproteobacteria bacterium GM202ARS2]|nr:GHKL domain-containing protein [Alphaproteobacteria bacterium GM202ARS2]